MTFAFDYAYLIPGRDELILYCVMAMLDKLIVVVATMYSTLIAQLISSLARFMACSGISGSGQPKLMSLQYGPILVMEQLFSWAYWFVVSVLRSLLIVSRIILFMSNTLRSI